MWENLVGIMRLALVMMIVFTIVALGAYGWFAMR